MGLGGSSRPSDIFSQPPGPRSEKAGHPELWVDYPLPEMLAQSCWEKPRGAYTLHGVGVGCETQCLLAELGSDHTHLPHQMHIVCLVGVTPIVYHMYVTVCPALCTHLCTRLPLTCLIGSLFANKLT